MSFAGAVLERPVVEGEWEIIVPERSWTRRTVAEEDRQARALLSQIWGQSWDSEKDQTNRLR
jgi:hypothetical protein